MNGRMRESAAGYGFILPNFLGFMLFTSLPVVASLLLSFYRWDLLSWPPKFVGLGNFRELVHDAHFWHYCWNTVFLMIGIPISMFASLLLAVLMNQKLPGMTFFKTVYFLPSITSGIAIYVLWAWIYNPEFGLMNWLLAQFGVEGPRWLESVTWAKPAMVIMGIWGSMGGMDLILYLAALQGVDPQLYEAAEMDGAGAWQRFWKITWPMVSPTTFFILIMGIIGGFQGGFDMAYVMTHGGPAGATTTVSYYIYNNAYEWFHMGYAAAIAWVLFLVILLVTLVNWLYSQRLVHYE